jgi:hypothetical protein
MLKSGIREASQCSAVLSSRPNPTNANRLGDVAPREATLGLFLF